MKGEKRKKEKRRRRSVVFHEGDTSEGGRKLEHWCFLKRILVWSEELRPLVFHDIETTGVS